MPPTVIFSQATLEKNITEYVGRARPYAVESEERDAEHTLLVGFSNWLFLKLAPAAALVSAAKAEPSRPVFYPSSPTRFPLPASEESDFYVEDASRWAALTNLGWRFREPTQPKTLSEVGLRMEHILGGPWLEVFAPASHFNEEACRCSILHPQLLEACEKFASENRPVKTPDSGVVWLHAHPTPPRA